MNTNTDLNLALLQIKRCTVAGRGVARLQRHRHASRLIRRPLRNLRNGAEVVATRRSSTRNLLDDHRRPRTPPPRRVIVVDLGCHIVSHQHLLHLRIGVVARHGEVHDVARVVLHHMHNATATVCPLRCRANLHRVRGRKQQPRASCVQHPLADEPGVHRLVTRPAAGDDGDAGGGVVVTQKPHEPLVVPLRKRMRGHKAAECLAHEMFSVVAERFECACHARQCKHKKKARH